MVSRKARNAETGKPVAEASLQDKTARKRGRANESNLERGSALPPFKHLPGCQGRIAFTDEAVMLGGIAAGIVENVTLQVCDAPARIQFHRFMNVRSFPTPACSFIKAQLAIGIPAAATNPPSHIERPPSDGVAIGQATLIEVAQGLDGILQLLGDAFIRVETEDPFV